MLSFFFNSSSAEDKRADLITEAFQLEKQSDEYIDTVLFIHNDVFVFVFIVCFFLMAAVCRGKKKKT